MTLTRTEARALLTLLAPLVAMLVLAVRACSEPAAPPATTIPTATPTATQRPLIVGTDVVVTETPRAAVTRERVPTVEATGTAVQKG